MAHKVLGFVNIFAKSISTEHPEPYHSQPFLQFVLRTAIFIAGTEKKLKTILHLF